MKMSASGKRAAGAGPAPWPGATRSGQQSCSQQWHAARAAANGSQHGHVLSIRRSRLAALLTDHTAAAATAHLEAGTVRQLLGSHPARRDNDRLRRPHWQHIAQQATESLPVRGELAVVAARVRASGEVIPGSKRGGGGQQGGVCEAASWVVLAVGWCSALSSVAGSTNDTTRLPRIHMAPHVQRCPPTAADAACVCDFRCTPQLRAEQACTSAGLLL